MSSRRAVAAWMLAMRSPTAAANAASMRPSRSSLFHTGNRSGGSHSIANRPASASSASSRGTASGTIAPATRSHSASLWLRATGARQSAATFSFASARLTQKVAPRGVDARDVGGHAAGERRDGRRRGRIDQAEPDQRIGQCGIAHVSVAGSTIQPSRVSKRSRQAEVRLRRAPRRLQRGEHRVERVGVAFRGERGRRAARQHDGVTVCVAQRAVAQRVQQARPLGRARHAGRVVLVARTAQHAPRGETRIRFHRDARRDRRAACAAASRGRGAGAARPRRTSCRPGRRPAASDSTIRPARRWHGAGASRPADAAA